VIIPADMLMTKVAVNLHTDNFKPIVATLSRNISGSMEGEAIQNDITGPKGTPPISNEVITGITPQEQNGLKAPMAVARIMESKGFLLRALLMYFAAPDRLITTARGIVMRRYGQI
jgi:hypothetical protein